MMMRSQSGTEMLTTYGITIFILALVIAAVVILTSAPPTVLPKSCSIYGGLQCSDIAYGANALGGSMLLVLASFSVPGTLNVSSFNAVVGGVQSTRGYCTTNGMTNGVSQITQGQSILCVAFFPSSSTTTLYSGTFNVSGNYCTGSLYSNCPGTAGYTFAGSWKAPGGHVISTSYINGIASNTTTTSTTTIRGGSSTTTTIHYLYISLTNSNSVMAAPSSFQQMITFNAITYNAYEANDLGNIRFYSGNVVPTSANAIYSWCESGCASNSVSNAVFWIKLPSGIGTSSTVMVNMTFLPTNTEYDGVYSGEAPQLTCTNSNTMVCGSTYAKYDNGANVFNSYYNFAGSSLGSSFVSSVNTGSALAVGNGLALITTSGEVSVQSASTLVGTNTVLDSLMTTFIGSSGSHDFMAVSNTNEGSGSTASLGFIGSGNGLTSYTSFQGGYTGYSGLGVYTPSVFGVTTLAVTGNTVKVSYNYNTPVSVTAPFLNPSSLYVIFPRADWVEAPQVGNFLVQWIRTRAYPPGDVMPSASYGSVN
jgi:hypothetical protein